MYIAEKSGKLLPKDPSKRYLALQWLFFQVSGLGPMFGQFMHFCRFAKEKIPYGIERYTTESKNVLGLLEAHLTGKEYIADEFSLADLATAPWVKMMLGWCDSNPEFGIASSAYPVIGKWVERFYNRPTIKTGLANIEKIKASQK